MAIEDSLGAKSIDEQTALQYLVEVGLEPQQAVAQYLYNCPEYGVKHLHSRRRSR